MLFRTKNPELRIKKGILLFLALWVYTGHLFSQGATAIKYAENIDQAELKQHLEIIASADMEGRATGTAGLEKAAAYISSQFREMNLHSFPSLNGFYQGYDFMKDTLVPHKFKIGENEFKAGLEYFISGSSQKQNEFKAKELVFAGYGMAGKPYSDYAHKSIKGKVAIIFPGEPKSGVELNFMESASDSGRSSRLSGKIKEANNRGAVAILLVDTAFNSRRENPLTTSLQSEIVSYKDDLRVIIISKEVFVSLLGQPEADNLIKAVRNKEVLNKFKFRKKTKIKLVYRKGEVLTRVNNVIGFVEGEDKKDEYVILSAHYDHLGSQNGKIFYGADDNGSGTSALLSMAEAFSKAKEAGFGPKRSVVFLAFSGEENGLLGSQNYITHPVFSLDSISALINTDMIGRVQSQMNTEKNHNYLYVVGEDKRSSELAGLITSVNEYSKLKLDYKYNNPKDPEMIYYRSDHYSFAKMGVPVVFFTNGTHKDYHLTTDTVDKIDFEILEKRTRFIFLTAWELANREGMLKRDLNTY